MRAIAPREISLVIYFSFCLSCFFLLFPLECDALRLKGEMPGRREKRDNPLVLSGPCGKGCAESVWVGGCKAAGRGMV